MSTAHNPVNFNPADYDVVDYIDNKRPVFLGIYAENFAAALSAYEEEVKAWEADNARLFGADWRGKIHRCIHCGNGNVRWIVALVALLVAALLGRGQLPAHEIVGIVISVVVASLFYRKKAR